MPNDDSSRRFVALIDAIDAGATPVADALAQFQPSLEDGYCVFNLHGEFAAAFGHQPQCAAALPLIHSLARKIVDYPEDDTMLLFNEPEWAQLVALRAPVEGVEVFHCDSCNRTVPQFMTSGFLDLRASTCNKCGDVLFHSTFEDEPLPRCECGGAFVNIEGPCPECGNQLRRVAQVSGYQYFATHKWRNQSS
jgi:hypothetical protein